jgi:hypothetical protein|tara:strand:+ start:382 stop:609 length:228 start_codon:yes stop_codon:yes gene_type:complete
VSEKFVIEAIIDSVKNYLSRVEAPDRELDFANSDIFKPDIISARFFDSREEAEVALSQLDYLLDKMSFDIVKLDD